MKYKKPVIFYSLLLAVGLFASCSSGKQTAITKNKSTRQQSEIRSDSSSNFIESWSIILRDEKLASLIESALSQNIDLKKGLLQIEIANAYYQMSKGAFYPTLQANVGVVPSNENFRDFAPIGTYTNFTSSWELDIWGRMKDRKESARARMLASSEGVRLVQTILTSEVAKAYFELQLDDQELEITERNIRLQTSAYEMVKVQKMAGRATNLAVLQFEAQLLNSQTQLHKIRRKIITTEQYLNIILNRSPQAIAREKSAQKSKLPFDIEQGIYTNLLNNRPDIISAALQAQAAGFDVEAARKAFYPSLTINAHVGLLASSPNLLFNAASLTWGVINGLTLPIFQNKQLTFNLKIKEAERKQALLNYQFVFMKGVSEVQTCISKLKSLKSEIEILENEVVVLESAVTNSHDLFAYGYANYLEVINTQKNAREAEIELNRVVNERSGLMVDLYRALGGGR